MAETMEGNLVTADMVASGPEQKDHFDSYRIAMKDDEQFSGSQYDCVAKDRLDGYQSLQVASAGYSALPKSMNEALWAMSVLY